MKKISPLSQTQLGIYSDCLSMQDKGAYNGHFLLTLDESIDMNRLAAAIEKAVAAHPSIFVRVTEKDGEPFLRLCPFPTATIKKFPLQRSRKLFLLITRR